MPYRRTYYDDTYTLSEEFKNIAFRGYKAAAISASPILLAGNLAAAFLTFAYVGTCYTIASGTWNLGLKPALKSFARALTIT
jgi:hypothetical protein